MTERVDSGKRNESFSGGRRWTGRVVLAVSGARHVDRAARIDPLSLTVDLSAYALLCR